uniref:Uncharacterized protein n=1 Tax=Meloidogyne hapla TaxID=6305 RepID=A0A1I8BNM0_MELHA
MNKHSQYQQLSHLNAIPLRVTPANEPSTSTTVIDEELDHQLLREQHTEESEDDELVKETNIKEDKNEGNEEKRRIMRHPPIRIVVSEEGFHPGDIPGDVQGEEEGQKWQENKRREGEEEQKQEEKDEKESEKQINDNNKIIEEVQRVKLENRNRCQ